MRPSRMVVGSALIAALALGALPGLTGSRAARPIEPIPVGAFQPLPDTAGTAPSTLAVGDFDPAFDGAGAVDADDPFIEPGVAPDVGPDKRLRLDQPDGTAGHIRKPALYSISGTATFYNAGYTAMRLPRGTVVIICGEGGCIERTINDYGPQTESRIVDLYKPDFFEICGCASWSGTTQVTVYVY